MRDILFDMAHAETGPSKFPEISLADFLSYIKIEESKVFELVDDIKLEELLALHTTLDLEVTILKFKNGKKLLIVGNKINTGELARDFIFESSESEVVVRLHSHTKSDKSRYPSGADFNGYDTSKGMHVLVNEVGVLRYKLPSELAEEDIRGVMIERVEKKLIEIGSEEDPFDVLMSDSNRFYQLFVESLPSDCLVLDPDGVIAALNSN